MPQICFSADPKLIAAIDEIAENMGRSRSYIAKTLMWSSVQKVMSKKPNNFGELLTALQT
jgi:predicted transcriptional regulator